MNDNKMTSLELRTTWGLGTVFSLRMLGMFMLLPVISIYGMTLEGATESLIGIAIGIYGLTQALLQIPLGLLADRIGRKPIIIAGLLLFALGSLIAFLSTSIWGIILGRALQGSGAISAAVMALLSDLTREQNRTKAMAFIGVSFGVTFAGAMVLGPIFTHAFGLQNLFFGMALLALLAIVITLFAVPSPNTPILNRESNIVKSSINKVIKNRRLLKLNFGIMSLHALLMSSFVVVPQVMENAGLAPAQHWQVYLVTMLISFATVVPVIIYAELQRKIKQVFIIAVALLLVAEIIWWKAEQHLWVIITAVQLFFIAFNVMEAILPSLISKEAPVGYKGTAMGIYATSQFVGVAIGGGMGGWILGLAGIETVFLAGGLLALLWLAVSCTMQEPPYVSSLRIILPSSAIRNSITLERFIKEQPGVTEVMVVKTEKSIYVKVDTKQTTRRQLEQLVNNYSQMY
ncbi:MFS transporter [Candidatus Regiella insecticola]|nr:MFS transporter [Candidatus Regiella insecticola]